MEAREALKVWVRSITFEAEGIDSYDLRPKAGGDLPQFLAGSQIDLHLPNRLIKSYPLGTRCWFRPGQCAHQGRGQRRPLPGQRIKNIDKSFERQHGGKAK